MASSEMYKTFIRAAQLLLPDVDEDDYRILELASYAKNKYYSRPDVPICVMCAINGTNDAFREFYQFCQRIGIDTERREAIVSDGKLFYTSDFSKWPTNIVA